MKILLSSLIGLALLPSLLFGHHHLSRVDVQHAIRNQMNGSSTGAITRDVRCARVGVAAKRAATTYHCVLTGTSGSAAHATVLVSGDSWRAEWAPVSG